jgi:UDP-4-amino-4,6-dideoxy-N-acetyl-beta-L-altrosamine transaminase
LKPNSTIPYSRQSIDEDDIKAVVEVLRSDLITQGPKVREFEAALAEYCGAKHTVVFSSGTAALHAAYFAAGIGPGEGSAAPGEIITSPITFVATANAALYLGARPVFVDIEPETGNINAELIAKAITENTRAIVPVHYAGHPADLDPIHEIAKKHGLVVIEDACHALGASYKGRKIGSLSDMTVFSFHPVKPITTGEGGAVVTNDGEFSERLRAFGTHGITKDAERFVDEPHGSWHYEMQHLGFNYRLTDIQAALGLSQLRKLDSFIKRREEIAAVYNEAFKDTAWFDLPAGREYAKSSWHLYPIRLKGGCLKRKAEIFRELRQQGLGVQVHYMPVYLQPYYRGLGYMDGPCPEAERFYGRELSIPVHQGMGDRNVKQVMKGVFDIFEE